MLIPEFYMRITISEGQDQAATMELTICLPLKNSGYCLIKFRYWFNQLYNNLTDKPICLTTKTTGGLFDDLFSIRICGGDAYSGSQPRARGFCNDCQGNGLGLQTGPWRDLGHCAG
jgi:hypothetical protein